MIAVLHNGEATPEERAESLAPLLQAHFDAHPDAIREFIALTMTGTTVYNQHNTGSGLFSDGLLKRIAALLPQHAMAESAYRPRRSRSPYPAAASPVKEFRHGVQHSSHGQRPSGKGRPLRCRRR